MIMVLAEKCRAVVYMRDFVINIADDQPEFQIPNKLVDILIEVRSHY